MKGPLAKEFDGFLKMKEKECAENGEVFSGTVEPWDIYHYMQVGIQEILVTDWLITSHII